MSQTRTRRLIETGIMLVVAVVLSLIQPFRLPFGGGITIASMLPLILISYRHGVKWGLFSSFAYGLLQILTDFSIVRAFFLPNEGYPVLTAFLIIFFDYFLAFTLLGFGGIFRNKIKNAPLALCLGTIVALFLRFAAHFISGYLFFGAWAEWFFTQDSIKEFGEKVLSSMSGNALAAFYSLCYNASFMVPEIIITAILAFAVGAVPTIAQKLDK